MLEDLRYAIRLLLRSPGFAVSAILAVALGIGANTAIFSAVQAVLVSPLPYAEPDRLAMVWEDASFASFPRNTPAPANWADWRKMNTVFAEIAATRGRSYSLTGEGAPERLIGRSTTASFWNVMGAAPLLGRVYTEAEENANASVAVLSYGLWQRRFGGERGVLGRKFLLDGQPFTVLAVMPRGFTFPSRQVEIWTPLSLGSQV